MDLSESGSPFVNLACESQFKAVAECSHIWIRVLHQFECIRNDFHRPGVEFGVLAGFEAEIEVSWVLGIDAERIN